jgi:hypothetical protein
VVFRAVPFGAGRGAARRALEGATGRARPIAGDFGRQPGVPYAVSRSLWRGLLYEGDTRPVIQAIEHLLSERPNAPEYVSQSLGYFKEHEDRMNYGELQAHGYFIGSGVIERACGHVVGDRLKGSGMKWSPDHVPSVLALRVCRASGWWDDFWKQDRRN